MSSRTSVAAAAIVAVLAAGFALVPAHAEQIHRHQFGGKKTVLLRGEANVRVDEEAHDISTLSFHSQPSSEHLKLKCAAATGDAAFVNYYYNTPPAPINEMLTAGVWVKATRAGIQLRARVVFPNEPDPANPQSALTTLIVGQTYPAEKSRQWYKLTLENVPDLLGKHLPVLQVKTGRAVNSAGAYIDQLVLNLYAGPGSTDIWIDDLDIGPIKPDLRPDQGSPGAPGIPAKLQRPGERPVGGRQIEQRGGQLFVDGKPFFFRSIRYTGTPLHVLRQAGFDTVWFPPETDASLLETASREGWLVVPSMPLAAARRSEEEISTIDRSDEGLNSIIRKFAGSDVLFWDLGGGRTLEQSARVKRTFDLIRAQDPRRPRGADLWEGFNVYSRYLDVVGAHRWPLFTNLDMAKYRDWLAQRRTLTAADRATYWTWIQNHLPDWYITEVLGQKLDQPFNDPIGPHPEQVRVMAYIAVACGCRGLGFWSDRYLADSHHGRDRLQGMALLNAELDMLSPVIMFASARTRWLETSNPNVKAALIGGTGGQRGCVLLPIWMGPGTQFVPDQGAIPELKVVVPLVQDGADPWRITPAGVECLAHNAKKEVGGTELTIKEFDLVAPIVFTSDRPKLVAWWQDYTRKYGQLAARWAMDMAAVEYKKVAAVHKQLTAMGVQVKGADVLFGQSFHFHEESRKQFAAEMYDKAYQDAMRALRPLRVIMRDHWLQATATLDTPTASQYAVSYFSLPKHWELFHEIQASHLSPNLLPHGGFEFNGKVPHGGVRVDALPGWSGRFGTSDGVVAAAGIIPAEKYIEKPETRPPPVPAKGPFAPGREIPSPDEGYTPPTPELGKSLLRLEVRRRTEMGSDGKQEEVKPGPLEHTFLAVDSPPVNLPPGTLVRVSAWLRVPQEIQGSADGLLFYDDAGGEPLAVRATTIPHWKHFHLYRRVPASGKISVTVALTGVGAAYVDDIRIEPFIPNASPSGVSAAGYRGR